MNLFVIAETVGLDAAVDFVIVNEKLLFYGSF